MLTRLAVRVETSLQGGQGNAGGSRTSGPGWFRVLMSPALSLVSPPDVREQQGEVLHADRGVGAAGAGGEGKWWAGSS